MERIRDDYENWKCYSESNREYVWNVYKSPVYSGYSFRYAPKDDWFTVFISEYGEVNIEITFFERLKLKTPLGKIEHEDDLLFKKEVKCMFNK